MRHIPEPSRGHTCAPFFLVSRAIETLLCPVWAQIQVRHLVGDSGFAEGAGCDGCCCANRDLSTRFLKSPASSFVRPLKPDWTTISQASPFALSTTELMRFWPIAPIPMENEAVISVLSSPKIPYLPELRSVSFTADHNVPQETEYMSLWVLANDGVVTINNKAAPANRLMGTLLSRKAACYHRGFRGRKLCC